jgi:hypothetical protein
MVICYCEDAKILTDRGEIEIRHLRAGDKVKTPERFSEVVFIGYESGDGDHNAPVRIRAGALGENLPHTDLRVSGGHCLYLDGNLIEAQLLENGHSILRDAHESTDYYHLQLDHHDVVWANGVLAETFRDNGGVRGYLQSLDETNDPAAGRAFEGQPEYAPRAEAGSPEAERIRAAINARVSELNAAGRRVA